MAGREFHTGYAEEEEEGRGGREGTPEPEEFVQSDDGVARGSHSHRSCRVLC